MVELGVITVGMVGRIQHFVRHSRFIGFFFLRNLVLRSRIKEES